MQANGKILIVDDNPSNVEIIQEILEEYASESAATGEEALEVASTLRPDLILLDIMLPGIDGYEVARRLRARGASFRPKIIMVSARAMVSERLEGYAAGADDYLTKPFDQHELLSKVKVFLRLKSVEEVDQIKTDILTLMSHGTGNPLNGILGLTEVLLSGDVDSADERTEMLRMIHDSGEQLQGLFRKVLKLSSIKAGSWEFTLSPDDLREVAADALREIGSDSSRGVSIVERFAEVPAVAIDREEIREVIGALLENAIHFSPPGKDVQVDIWSEEDDICLSVTDHGEGIGQEFLPRVFDEFTVEDLKRHTEGQGLSLAVSRQIVLQHNGSLEVESLEGGGTKFTLRLPHATRVDLTV